MEINNGCHGVQVQQLVFSYSRVSKRNKPEIDNANLSVPRGVIYGLLGPSGCGKTTLLRCIIGRLRPQKGIVRVFDTEPGYENYHFLYIFFIVVTITLTLFNAFIIINSLNHIDIKNNLEVVNGLMRCKQTKTCNYIC